MSGYSALVTGGSRGIGKGIALALAEKGFAIAVNALEQDAELDNTLSELRTLGVEAASVIGDVSDIARREAVLDEAEAAIGPLTTLVNNAGVSVMSRGDILNVTPESYDRCQAVNARGLFFLTQAWASPNPVASCSGGRASFRHYTLLVECCCGLDHAKRILRFESRSGDDRKTLCRASGRRGNRFVRDPARPHRDADDGAFRRILSEANLRGSYRHSANGSALRYWGDGGCAGDRATGFLHRAGPSG